MTDLDALGGEDALTRIINDFVDRCFDDIMIGFLFRRADRDRVKRFEFEHARAHLGDGSAPYTGRPLRKAHGAHSIFGGHFARRRQILLETLTEHGAPSEVIERWIARQEALRGEIVDDEQVECRDS